jgi:hypothetical protein
LTLKESEYGLVDWIHLTQVKVKWPTVANTKLYPFVPQKKIPLLPKGLSACPDSLCYVEVVTVGWKHLVEKLFSFAKSNIILIKTAHVE